MSIFAAPSFFSDLKFSGILSHICPTTFIFPRYRNLRALLAMTICYSANVGGTGTVIGSTPNLAFTEYLEDLPGNPISFGSYMGFAVPQAVICLVVVYVWLQVHISFKWLLLAVKDCF